MSAPISIYTLSMIGSAPPDIAGALIQASRRWGSAVAVRVEDVGNTLPVFRPRFRVGTIQIQFNTTLFIEHGSGTTWSEAFADADLRERHWLIDNP